jgi:WD40 repeat protein
MTCLAVGPVPSLGLLLVAAGDGKCVHLWDATTGARHGEPLVGSSAAEVTSMAFGLLQPQGTLVLACGGDDGGVWAWDVNPRTPYLTSPLLGREHVARHGAPVLSVAFSPPNTHLGGTLLASASEDRTVCVTDVATGAHVRTLACTAEFVRAVAFGVAPPALGGGRLLATCDSDGTVRLWEPVSGCRVGPPMPSHHGRVSSLAFGPGVVVTGGDCVRVWDLAAHTLVWASRSPYQKLDGVGLQLAGCRGLSTASQALLAYSGCGAAKDVQGKVWCS